MEKNLIDLELQWHVFLKTTFKLITETPDNTICIMNVFRVMRDNKDATYTYVFLIAKQCEKEGLIQLSKTGRTNNIKLTPLGSDVASLLYQMEVLFDVVRNRNKKLKKSVNKNVGRNKRRTVKKRG